MSIIKCMECSAKVSSKAQMCPKCGAPVDIEAYEESLKGKIKPFWVFTAIIISLILYSTFEHRLPSVQAERLMMSNLSVKVKAQTLLGTVMVGSVTVQNKNPFGVKDISVFCYLYSKSGKSLGNADTNIYDVVKAKSTRTFRDVNFGRIDSQTAIQDCSINRIKKSN